MEIDSAAQQSTNAPVADTQSVSGDVSKMPWTRNPRMSAKRRQAAARGMVVLRARLYEDKDGGGMPIMPFERKGKDLIMRVLLEGVDAEVWAGIKETFKGNKPYLLMDKTGIVCQLRDTIASGQKTIRHSKDKILEVLPKGTDLPSGIAWGDFTERQLVALALLTDVMSSNTRAQVAAIAGVEVEDLNKWESNDKFLRVKWWLLERQKHRIREEGMKNLATGQQSEDEAMKFAWTKLGLEVLGYVGRRDKAQTQAKDSKLVEDVHAELGDMSQSDKDILAHDLQLTVAILTGKNQVMLSGDGSTLSVKAKEEPDV